MDLREHIDSFFSSARRLGTALGDPSFAYAAIKRNGRFEIAQARLLLGTIGPFSPFGEFETENVKAAHFPLRDVNLTAEAFVEKLLGGACPTPKGEVYFATNDSGQFGGYYQPFHPDGISVSQRIRVLNLFGGPLDLQSRMLDLDWELKAAAEPFDSLQELYNRFRLSTIRTDATNIEVVALGVLAVDLSTSIKETECEVAVRMSSLADRKLVSVGYRVLHGDQVTRGRIEASLLSWSPFEDGIIRGSTTLTVPKAAVVQAYATYDGTVTHQAWIVDPTTGQNPRRAAYEAFDAGLTSLSELLLKPAGRGNARDLEAGVAWLLWMLGFSPAHFGMTARLQEAPDIIAMTPSGSVVVVECTTGPLKTDNKLPLLLERTEAVKSRLAASGNHHFKVLPVIVTSKRRIEVRADLEQAEKLGVLVITSEILTSALPRTLTKGDADQVFAEGQQTVADALERHTAQGVLPL